MHQSRTLFGIRRAVKTTQTQMIGCSSDNSKVKNSSSLRSEARRSRCQRRTSRAHKGLWAQRVCGGRTAAIKSWHGKSSRVTGSMLEYPLTKNTRVQTQIRGSVNVKTQLNTQFLKDANVQQLENSKSNCETFDSEWVKLATCLYTYVLFTCLYIYSRLLLL